MLDNCVTPFPGSRFYMFIHLITICIGLIIAVGLQQIYDLFQRRRAQRKLDATGKGQDQPVEAPRVVRQKKWPWER